MTVPEQAERPLAGVRMVVWDLDETIWTGTLSEGEVVLRSDPPHLIPALARSGVPSTVCSNNDPAPAQMLLEAWELWRWIVFPRVAWRPKIQMLEEIVVASRLRPRSVLLVDDQARIRAEAERTLGVRTLDSTDLEALWELVDERVDPHAERLAQYRVLERRETASEQESGTDPTGFLRASDIRLHEEDPRWHLDRIVVLVSRAHRLNHTRRALDLAGLRYLLARPEVEARAVRVTDAFGDYGISGFYALDRSRATLLHFVFSCRLLHMGVESFLYQRLGCPAIATRPGSDAPSPPSGDPDWITMGDGRGSRAQPRDRSPGAVRHVLLKGECDLQVMQTYLAGDGALQLDWEVLEIGDGVQRYGHSSVSVLLAVADGQGDIVRSLPWLRNAATAAYGGGHDVLVLSLWVDYACQRYQHRETGVSVPSFARLNQRSSEWEWRHWWGESSAGRADFLRDFVERPAVAPGELEVQLAELRRRLPSATRLVVLNCPEVPVPWRYADGSRQHERHELMNAAVDRVAQSGAVHLVDLRAIIRDRGDLDESAGPMLSHYTRDAYARLAREVRSTIAAVCAETEPR